MDPEMRRRATPSEQRQHDDEMRGDDVDRHADCEDDPCDECKPVLDLCADPDCSQEADGKKGKYCTRHEAEYDAARAEWLADEMHYERFDRDR